MTLSLSLKKKRVLVTAAASGIGRAIAENFAAHGACVHICDINENAIQECLSENSSLTATICDVSNEDQVIKMFKEIENNLGGLDVLVNNAGIPGPIGLMEELEAAEWQRTININLNGHFLCTKLAIPYLKSNQDGAIVNISSVAGRFGFANRTPYAASKWGVIGLTQSLAKELGPSGVRVNAILPGAIDGPRMDKIIQERAKQQGISPEEVLEGIVNNISLRRLISVQDIANMALFLCSPLGRNLSGQSISVCGNTESM